MTLNDLEPQNTKF